MSFRHCEFHENRRSGKHTLLRGSMKFRTYLPDFTTDFGITAKENANNNLLGDSCEFHKNRNGIVILFSGT